MSLDAELEMSDGVVTDTRCPTGHYLLIDARFELPFGKFSIRIRVFQINPDVAIIKYSYREMFDELMIQ